MSTAMFRPLILTSAEMTNLDISEGRLLMVTDTREMYIDKDNNSRVKMSSATGEIPIGEVTNLNVTSGDEEATIKWKDPQDVEAAGIAYSTWAGTKVVLKEGSYPISPEDGTLIVNNTIRDQYSISGYNITGLTNGVTYYGRLFPYSTIDYINMSDNNKFILEPHI